MKRPIILAVAPIFVAMGLLTNSSFVEAAPPRDLNAAVKKAIS